MKSHFRACGSSLLIAFFLGCQAGAFDCDSTSHADGTTAPLVRSNANLDRLKAIVQSYGDYLAHLESGHDFASFSSPIFRPPLQWMLASYESGAYRLGNNSSNFRHLKEQARGGGSQGSADTLLRYRSERDLVQSSQAQRLDDILRQENVSMGGAYQEGLIYTENEGESASELEFGPNAVPGPVRWGIERVISPGQMLVPTAENWSIEDFINVSAYPIFVRGLTNNMVRADGGWMRRDSMWGHDFGHDFDKKSTWFDFAGEMRAQGPRGLVATLRTEISTRLRCGCQVFSRMGDQDAALKLIWFAVDHESGETNVRARPGDYVESLKRHVVDAVAAMEAEDFERAGVFEGYFPANLSAPRRKALILIAMARLQGILETLDPECRSKPEEQEESEGAKSAAALRARLRVLGIAGPVGAALAIRPRLAKTFPALSDERKRIAVLRTLAELAKAGTPFVALQKAAMSLEPPVLPWWVRYALKVGSPFAAGYAVLTGETFNEPSGYPENPEHYVTFAGVAEFAGGAGTAELLLRNHPEMAAYFIELNRQVDALG